MKQNQKVKSANHSKYTNFTTSAANTSNTNAINVSVSETSSTLYKKFLNENEKLNADHRSWYDKTDSKSISAIKFGKISFLNNEKFKQEEVVEPIVSIKSKHIYNLHIKTGIIGPQTPTLKNIQLYESYLNNIN